MGKYKFSLHFDNEDGSLKNGKGIPFHEIAKLLQDLSVAMGKQGNIVLENISRNSYEPAWSTDALEQHDNFISLNRDIAEKSIIDLPIRQANYAKGLRRILSDESIGKRLYCEVRDTNGAKVVRLYKEDINKAIEYYYATKTISGKILLIGNPTVEKRAHINVESVNYPINITETQDEQLSPHYKGGHLSFRIRQRISLQSNRVIVAELIGFNVKDQKSFPNSLNDINLSSFDTIN
jgi:hypothetical protein